MKNSTENYQYSRLRSAVSRGVQVGLCGGVVCLGILIFTIIKVQFEKNGASWLWGLLPASIFGLLALGSFFDSWRCKKKLKQYLATLSAEERKLLEQIENMGENEEEENVEDEYDAEDYDE